MAIEFIDSKQFKNMFIASANYLNSKKDYCNELNVFPVPDGDTGTNMSLTVIAAIKEIEKVDSSNMAEVAKAISSGTLRGARGNSGVITSQLFRGFAKEVGQHEKVDAVIYANALAKGVDTAYKAVMKPKEGTILTVAKEAAAKAAEICLETTDMITFMEQVIEHAEITLQKTPDMLPVLKEAGVVDAGGQGYLYILRGALWALKNGGEVIFSDEASEVTKEVDTSALTFSSTEDIEFGYCTEFLINVGDDLESEREAIGIKRYLETIGDSIVAVADDDIIKIHVHTNEPNLALQKGLSAGYLTSIKIDNMRVQHTNILAESIEAEKEEKVTQQEEKENGFVVVSIGEGLSTIFDSLGADYIVEGGQTMNPSTEDIVKAIENVNAKNVFVLPNNKNIILAANQAKDIIDDKNVSVITSTSVPEGISAMISFDNTLSVDENFEAMMEGVNNVSTGKVTYAIRDTSVEGLEINEGDLIGIGNDKILTAQGDTDSCVKDLIDKMLDEDSELLSIYYGEEISEETANELAAYVEDKYEDVEVEVYYGGQPIYYYILSVE